MVERGYAMKRKVNRFFKALLAGTAVFAIATTFALLISYFVKNSSAIGILGVIFILVLVVGYALTSDLP